ncbi:hypothetical protein [Zhongshania marina]|uniref:Uncharacterized protein n=1 Tax=Zhongshania marina TaxID=2304603 RepID=A0A2S4HB84_9GAMM|nr:hypothetical protein [Marortus luteolus]POP50991.1 hypothetical protein C0068_19350 [Marortus luteolus]
MQDLMIGVAKIVLPGILIAIFTSIITVKLSIRKFHEEKWWEKKQQTYSNLLEALHHLKNYASEHYEGQLLRKDMNEEKREELTSDWKKYSRELRKLMDLASFQLSDKAVEILDLYSKEKTEAEQSDDIYDWIDGDLAAVTKCLDNLKIEAKRDLKV